MAEESTNQRPLHFPQVPFACIIGLDGVLIDCPRSAYICGSDSQWIMPRPVTEDSPT